MNIPKSKIEEHNKDLASILAKLAYHIDPDIVKYIIERNKVEYPFFENMFGDIINIKNYLFDDSDCVFPGVRRWDVDKGKKRQYNEKYKAIIDDNGFPRYIWCYLYTGKGASGPNWKNFNEFELAHIFAHKDAELITEKKYFKVFDDKNSPYAQFTSASNVVLLPKGTVRPTDNSTIIKPIFYKRHIELYGENTLNGRKNFKHEAVPVWYSELDWNEPLKPDNWKHNIDLLLDYRNQKIKSILEKAGFSLTGIDLPPKCGKNTKNKNSNNKEKDHTKYKLDERWVGGIQKKSGKGQLVLTTVKAYFRKHQNITFEDLNNVFSGLQSEKVGFFETLAQAKTKFKKQKKEKIRHFINDPIVLSDGQQIVVSREWGKSNIEPFIERARSLGFTIAAYKEKE